MEIIENVWFG